MKAIYTLSVLILLCIGCGEPKSTGDIAKERRDYILKMIPGESKVVNGADYNIKPNADSVYVRLSFKLINHTMAKLSYLNLSCQESAVYTTDNNKVKLISAPCDKNVPELYEAPANSASGRELLVVYKKANGPQKFRLGMTLHAQAEDFGNTGIDRLLADTTKLIWSAPAVTP